MKRLTLLLIAPLLALIGAHPVLGQNINPSTQLRFVAPPVAYSVVFTGTTATGNWNAAAGPGALGYPLVSGGAGTLPAFSNSLNTNITIGGTLGVTGAATVGGTLGVTGAITTSAGITQSGNSLFSADNTYDIGTAANFRPRDILMGRALTVGTDINLGNGYGVIVGGTRILVITPVALGIGVPTPSTWSSVKALEVGTVGNSVWGAGVSVMRIGANIYQDSVFKFAGTDYATMYSQESGEHVWKTSSASGTAGNTATMNELMRLSAAGVLSVGAQSGGQFNVTFPGSAIAGHYWDNTDTGSGGQNTAIIRRNASTVGSIQTTNIATLFNTTSDARLKSDLGAATSTDTLKQTRIHRYKWKGTGQQETGVFAQEAAKVKPQAVAVGNDERDEKGNLKNPWQVDYSKYVPDLVVGWQNHEARIAKLEKHIATLEAALKRGKAH